MRVVGVWCWSVCLGCTWGAGWGVDRVCWVHTPDPGWYPVGKGAGTPLEDPSGRVSGPLSGGWLGHGLEVPVWACSGSRPRAGWSFGEVTLGMGILCILLIQGRPRNRG